METEKINTLIIDTLTNRRIEMIGCFGTNASARELRDMGEPILPIIASVIVAEIDSANVQNESQLVTRFPGLSSLFGTFFALSREFAIHFTTNLLRQLHGLVLVEAMRSINTVWFLHRDHGQPLPRELELAINDLALKGENEVRQTAIWLMNRIEQERSGRLPSFPHHLFDNPS